MLKQIDQQLIQAFSDDRHENEGARIEFTEHLLDKHGLKPIVPACVVGNAYDAATDFFICEKVRNEKVNQTEQKKYLSWEASETIDDQVSWRSQEVGMDEFITSKIEICVRQLSARAHFESAINTDSPRLIGYAKSLLKSKNLIGFELPDDVVQKVSERILKGITEGREKYLFNDPLHAAKFFYKGLGFYTSELRDKKSFRRNSRPRDQWERKPIIKLQSQETNKDGSPVGEEFFGARHTDDNPQRNAEDNERSMVIEE